MELALSFVTIVEFRLILIINLFIESLGIKLFGIDSFHSYIIVGSGLVLGKRIKSQCQ